MINEERLLPTRLGRAARLLFWGALLAMVVRGIAWILTLGGFGPVLGGASTPIRTRLDGQVSSSTGDLFVLIEAALAGFGVIAALLCSIGLARGWQWATQAARGLGCCFVVDATFVLGSSGWWLAAAASDVTPLQWIVVAALLAGQLVLLWWAAMLVRLLGNQAG